VTIRSSLRTRLLDALTGFLALGLLMALAFATRMKFDLRWFFGVAAGIACALGFLREKDPSGSPWSKGLLLISGFCLPIVVLSVTGMAFGPELMVGLVLASSISIFGGIFGRKAWSRQQPGLCVVFSLLPVACVVCASLLVLPRLMEKLSGKHVNLPEPEFSLVTDDGKSVSASSMKGKVVVMAFWATWCQPCWQELPRVEKVYASYKDNRGVLFWAVNAHSGGDTDESARAWATKMRLVLPLAYTENANAARLGIHGYPALVLLDSSGHIRFIHHGYDASEPLELNLVHEITSLVGQGG